MSETRTRPRRGDWCVIEHELSRGYLLEPGAPPPAPEKRFELARVVRASREGTISHACPPHK